MTFTTKIMESHGSPIAMMNIAAVAISSKIADESRTSAGTT